MRPLAVLLAALAAAVVGSAASQGPIVIEGVADRLPVVSRGGLYAVRTTPGGRITELLRDSRHLLRGRVARGRAFVVRPLDRWSFDGIPVYELLRVAPSSDAGSVSDSLLALDRPAALAGGGLWSAGAPQPPHSLEPVEDTDADGIPDAYEVRNNMRVGVADADGDADGDGMFNRAEAEAGTSAGNPHSRFDPRVVPSRSFLSPFAIEWEGVSGRYYQLYTSSDLNAGWSPSGEPMRAYANGPFRVNLPDRGTTTFFRVSASLTPSRTAVAPTFP